MIPQTLFNTNMFIGGQSLQGDVPSLSLPKVTVKTEEYRGGGMDASVAMDMGLEKLEASFATNGVRREVLKYFGAFDQTGFDASFRGAFKGQKGATTAVVATLRGGLREVDPGEWSAGSKAEFKYAVGGADGGDEKGDAVKSLVSSGLNALLGRKDDAPEGAHLGQARDGVGRV